MKTANFRIRLVTHVLAHSVNDAGQRDMFLKDADGKLLFSQSWFYAAFNKSIEISGLRGVKPGDINMDLVITAPTEMYKRKYGCNQYRTHEAIMPGTEISFDAMVADHVTKTALETILNKMGKFVGISPFGHNLGFGKFTLLSVEVAPSDSASGDAG